MNDGVADVGVPSEVGIIPVQQGRYWDLASTMGTDIIWL